MAMGMSRALVLVAVAVLFLGRTVYAYRVQNSSQVKLPFAPYEQGFVRQYGDPLVYQRERVNEGAPATEDQPRLFAGVHPRQLCPNMVGPLNGIYYCRGKEYGFCDQRSGVCFCSMGYTGLGCEKCSPTHFEMGDLCYPKKPCPGNCEGGGSCDYTTGQCRCYPHRYGPDCSRLICTHFHQFCTRCTNTTCLECLPGFSVGVNQTCQSCTRFDPRCTVCDAQGCLTCGDPLLLSSRRSGHRVRDPPLPFEDDKARPLSMGYPFGTQLPDYFDEAEVFIMVGDRINQPLNATSRRCDQGQQGDDQFTCHSHNESHVVCGHPGTVAFSSPTYWVKEGQDDFVRIVVERTGGGYGRVLVNYTLQHLTTTPADLHATAYYTSSQTLIFDEGVVQISFLVTIHDDSELEADEQFALHLTDVTGGGKLGPTSTTIVTIADDDSNKTSPFLSYPEGPDLTTVRTAGQVNNLTIHARSFWNISQRVGGDLFLVSVENTPDGQPQWGVPQGQARVAYTDGHCQSLGNGSYACNWNITKTGEHLVRVFQLIPYGLDGDYYDDAFFQNRVFSRVDHIVNFTWGIGRLTESAVDFTSIRWHGRLLANHTEEYVFQISYDDHVRLWVDHTLLIDQWDRGEGLSHARVNLTAGNYHHLVVEYREMREHARVQLWWSSPHTPLQIVPKYNLFRQQELAGSPITQHVISDLTDAATSLCEGSGLVNGVAGETVSFYIYPRDRYGNYRHDVLDNDPSFTLQEARLFHAEATLIDNRGHGRGTTTVTSTIEYDPTKHAFLVEYVPTISGIYSLNITYQYWRFYPQISVDGSPFLVTVSEARTFGQRCRLVGNGLTMGTTGVRQNFTIHARDALDNIRHSGGDTIDVMAYHHSGAYVAQGQVQDLQNGTYEVSLTPSLKGLYQLYILLKSPQVGISYSMNVVSHMGSSPYSLFVHYNTAWGPTSIAEGPGLVSAIVGYQTQFLVHANDRWSNGLEDGNFNLTVWSYAAQPVNGTVINYHNGTCLVLYTPHSSGINLLSVTIDGQHIKGSPFSVPVEDGDDKAGTSTASGMGIFTAMAGELASFVVQARDKYGNPRTTDHNHLPHFQAHPMFNLTMSGPGHVVNTSVYLRDGQHLLQYNATVAGDYNLTVQDTVTGELIASSPFHLYVRPAPSDGLLTYLHDSGIVGGNAGTVQPTSIHGVDAFGNDLDRGGDLYLATLVGPFNCSESPCAYDQVSPPPSRPLPWLPTLADYNWVMKSASEAYNGTNGFHPYDAIDWDNRYRAIPIPVTDLGNGTYRIPYIPRHTGTYQLQVKLGVAGALWASYYRTPGYKFPLGSRKETSSNISSAWGVHGPELSYHWGNVSLYSHEGFGVIVRGFLTPPEDDEYRFRAVVDTTSQVDLSIGGRMVLEGAAKGYQQSNMSYMLSKGEMYEVVLRYQHDIGGGEEPRLSLQWTTPKDGGLWSLVPSSAQYLFYQVSNVTHLPLITPAPLYPPASNASGEGLQSAVAGYKSNFTLYARDVFGNLLETGGDRIITVLGRGPSKSAFILGTVAVDHGNGTYLIEYLPSAAGNYSMLVTIGSVSAAEDLGYYTVEESLASAHIQGSPFFLQVAPGPFYAPTTFATGSAIFSATAGALSLVTINPRDLQNNPLVDDDAIKEAIPHLAVYLQQEGYLGPNSTAIALNATLTYQLSQRTILATYNATKAGRYSLHVMFKGQEVAGSPYGVTVSPNVAYGSECVAAIPSSFRRNVTNTFRTTAVDYWGNSLDHGGHNFFVKVVGPQVVYPAVVDQGDGTYIMSFQPSFRGMYRVYIELASKVKVGANPSPGGLTGQYYNDRRMQGTPVSVRMDPALDFDLGLANVTETARDHLGVKWTGFIMAPISESFRFTTTLGGYDVVRLFIANQLVIYHDNTDGETRRATGRISLHEGRLYEVRVELEHDSGPCSLALSWESNQTPQQVVPTYYLFHDSRSIKGSPFDVLV